MKMSRSESGERRCVCVSDADNDDLLSLYNNNIEMIKQCPFPVSLGGRSSTSVTPKLLSAETNFTNFPAFYNLTATSATELLLQLTNTTTISPFSTLTSSDNTTEDALRSNSNNNNNAAANYAAITRLFTDFVNGWLTLTIIAIGTILNLICIVVFMQPRLRRTGRPVIYSYLILLSLWDLALLTPGALLMYSLPTVYFGRLTYFAGQYSYVFPYAYYISNVTMTGSVWTILAASIDRYYALCHPLRHRLVNKSRLPVVLCALSISACIFALPEFYRLKVSSCYIDYPTYQVILYIDQSKWAQHALYSTWYRIVGGLMFDSLLPYVILVILAALIVYKLRHDSFVKQQEQQQRQVAQSCMSYSTMQVQQQQQQQQQRRPPQQQQRYSRRQERLTPDRKATVCDMGGDFDQDSVIELKPDRAEPELELERNGVTTSTGVRSSDVHVTLSDVGNSAMSRTFPKITKNLMTSTQRTISVDDDITQTATSRRKWTNRSVPTNHQKRLVTHNEHRDTSDGTARMDVKRQASLEEVQSIPVSNTEICSLLTRTNTACASRRTHRNQNLFVAVVVKFICGRLLCAALDLLEKLVNPKIFRSSHLITVTVAVSNLLVVLNSATNFIVYMMLSRRFRSAVNELASGTFFRNHDPAASNLTAYDTPYMMQRKATITHQHANGDANCTTDITATSATTTSNGTAMRAHATVVPANRSFEHEPISEELSSDAASSPIKAKQSANSKKSKNSKSSGVRHPAGLELGTCDCTASDKTTALPTPVSRQMSSSTKSDEIVILNEYEW